MLIVELCKKFTLCRSKGRERRAMAGTTLSADAEIFTPTPNSFQGISVNAQLCTPAATSLQIRRPGPVSNVLRVVVCRKVRARFMSAMVVLQSLCSPNLFRMTQNFDGAIYVAFYHEMQAAQFAGHAYMWEEELVGFVWVNNVAQALPYESLAVVELM